MKKIFLFMSLLILKIVWGQDCPKSDDGIIGKGDCPKKTKWYSLSSFNSGNCIGGCGRISLF